LISDTIYFDVNVVECPGGKNPDTGKIAMQDVQSIEIAGTNLLIGTVLITAGVVVLGYIMYYLYFSFASMEN